MTTSIVLIAGSPSASSRSGAVLRSLSAHLQDAGWQPHILAVRDLDPHALIHARFDHPDIERAIAQVAGAAAVVVSTPVYKAAYSGVLKTFLDLLPQNALADKVVFPIATGGSPAHLLSLEYALKPVLSALGANQFLPALYIQDSQVLHIDPPQFEPEIERRLQNAVAALPLPSASLDTSYPLGVFAS